MVSIRLLDFTTTGTLLGGIASINRLDGYTPLLRLVLQNTSEAGECPVGEASVHRAALIALDTVEVFENDNSNIIAVFKYRLYCTMEKVIPEAVLTSRERLQSLPARRCAFGFQFSTAKSHLGRAMVQFTASNELAIRGYGEMSYALVDAENSTFFSLRRCVLGDAYIEIPAAVSIEESASSNVPRSIEELQLVIGQFNVDVDTIPKHRKGNVVFCHLRGSTIKCNRWLLEQWLCLGLLPVAGIGSSRFQGTGHQLEASTKMVGLEARESFAHIVVAQIMDAIGRKLLRIPSPVRHFVEHLHEDFCKFGKLFVVLVAKFYADCSFHVTYEYTCLKDDCKGERLVSSVA